MLLIHIISTLIGYGITGLAHVANLFIKNSNLISHIIDADYGNSVLGATPSLHSLIVCARCG